MTRRAYLTPDIDAAHPAVCRVLRIPPHYLPAVSGALGELALSYNWEEYGDITPEQAATDMLDLLISYYESEGCMIGQVVTLLTLTPPNGVLLCDGQSYQRADYPTLYDRLDAVYHISGTEFRVPDFRNRFMKGWGVETIDNTGGEAAHTLTTAEMPAHSHLYQPPSINPDVEGPGIPDIGATVLGLPTQTGSAGSGNAHNNEPPYLVVAFGVVAL